MLQPTVTLEWLLIRKHHTALLQKSGFRLGWGQYRNAVASGQFSNIRYSWQIWEAHVRPDATALRYWPYPTM